MAAHDDLFSDNDYHIRYLSFWFCDVAQVSIIHKLI
jgi:hypothetical protein